MTDREKAFLVLGAMGDANIGLEICIGLGISLAVAKECLGEAISFQRVNSWRWDGSKYATDRIDRLAQRISSST